MKLIASILFPALLLAQQVQPPALIYRIIEYEPDGSDQMQSFQNVLSPLTVRVEPLLKIVTLVGTSKEQIDEGEAIIRKYYKLRPITLQSSDRNVELTLYVLLGKPGGEPSSVPAILNPVIAQLRQVSSLTSFREIEAQIVRVRAGSKMETAGVLSLPELPENTIPLYKFSGLMSVSGTKVRLDNLRFGGRMPYKSATDQYQYREYGFDTSLDITPGQQVVVGKANSGVKDSAIILVLSAKIVD